jgi:outer membrane protein
MAGFAQAPSLAPLVPEVFKQLWQQTEQNSPLLKSEVYRLESAQKGVKVAQANQKWQLHWQGELSMAQMKKSFARTANNLTLSYPLYQPQLSTTEALKQVQTQAAQWRVQVQQRTLFNQVAKRYTQWLLAKEKQRFAQREIQAITDILQQLKQRYQLGLVQFNEISEVQSRLSLMKVAQLKAQQQADEIWQKLTALVGNPPLSLKEAEIGLATDQSLIQLQKQLNSILKNCQNSQSCQLDVEEHPLLKVIQSQMMAQRQKEAVVKARYAPKVTAFGSYVYNDSGKNFYDDMQGAKAGIQFKVPLYVAGADSAEQAEQRAQWQSLQAQRVQIQQDLQARAQTVWQDLKASSQQLSLLMRARHATEQAVKATEAGLKTGQRSILEVLNAQRDWDEAQRKLYSTQYEIWRIIAEWKYLSAEMK